MLAKITFNDEAGEILDTLVETLQSYAVTVTTNQGEEIGGYVVGVPKDASAYSTLRIADVGGDWSLVPSDTLPVREVVATRIHVH